MSITPRPSLIFVFALVSASLAAIGCGSSSPTAPSGLTVSGVALSANSVAAGTTVQGTVRLSAVAAAATTIALTSSNPAVATVPASATVAGGVSAVVVTVTGVAAGTATITASLNGATEQSPSLTVTAGVTLSSIVLTPDAIVGGNRVSGTVTLSAAAPADGAVVVLSTTDPASVTANVVVAAGAITATFGVDTRRVDATVSISVTGAYAGASRSAALSVRPPVVPTASFGVSGETESETCALTNGGSTLDCTFNGSTSSAPGTITAWDWSYTIAKTFTQTTSGPVLTMPAVDCSFVPPPPLPAGISSFTMTVRLTIHVSLGNVSAEAINSGVRVFATGVCGY